MRGWPAPDLANPNIPEPLKTPSVTQGPGSMYFYSPTIKHLFGICIFIPKLTPTLGPGRPGGPFSPSFPGGPWAKREKTDQRERPGYREGALASSPRARRRAGERGRGSGHSPPARGARLFPGSRSLQVNPAEGPQGT